VLDRTLLSSCFEVIARSIAKPEPEGWCIAFLANLSFSALKQYAGLRTFTLNLQTTRCHWRYGYLDATS
jgi:hypothetical protein